MSNVSFLRPKSALAHVKLPSWIGKSVLKQLPKERKTPETTEAVFRQSKLLVEAIFPEAAKQVVPVLNAQFFRSAKEFTREELEGETQTAMLAGIRQIEREHFELEF